MVLTLIVNVKTHDGYKASERPRAFELENKWHEITAILDRWYGPDYEYFKAQTKDNKIHILKYDRHHDSWAIDIMANANGRGL